MDITNIFCQSLGVTSHAKTFLTVCRFRTDLVSVWTAWGIRSKTIVIRSSGFGYLFGKNCHPFERLGLSVWKKLSSVRKAWDICLKKMLSVRTAWAIRLKKIVIRSNGLGYLFEKNVIRSNGSGYPLKKGFVNRSSNWSYLFKDKF